MPQLKEFTLAGGVLYGPVRSRRLGASLGINILPFNRKICSFNCGYCQCGWTETGALRGVDFLDPEAIRQELAAHLRRASSEGVSYDSLTLAGNGEPTLHPRFPHVVELIVRARDEWMPSARVSILSNSASVDDPSVRRGLDLLDERIMKLDAGSGAKIGEINMPVASFSLEKVVAGLKLIKDVVLQSMFVDGETSNSGNEDVRDWIDVVGTIAPRFVQIYTLDRVPADRRLLPVEKGRLREIADRLRRETGVVGEVF
ncbi:MAG: hypothetical protein A2Z34_05990 [Planctomycetes bacterium RBG_16_59_8]|nr:MAG: hypothetical protein A2Z34_05990 [Planctomycetes bacterium RBG_16_59_8]